MPTCPNCAAPSYRQECLGMAETDVMDEFCCRDCEQRYRRRAAL